MVIARPPTLPKAKPWTASSSLNPRRPKALLLAEQFYVSVSRAREAVTVYTDDKARLVETIQSSGARMAAHELLKLSAPAEVMDTFESMLREKVVVPSAEWKDPDLTRENEDHGNKIQPTGPASQSQQMNPFNFSEPERARQGISL